VRPPCQRKKDKENLQNSTVPLKLLKFKTLTSVDRKYVEKCHLWYTAGENGN
jgi:hypothetical protein